MASNEASPVSRGRSRRRNSCEGGGDNCDKLSVVGESGVVIKRSLGKHDFALLRAHSESRVFVMSKKHSETVRLRGRVDHSAER